MSNDILNDIFSEQPFYITAKGFKIFYYHPLDDTSNQIWKTLKNIDSLRVIHLKRKNILRTLVSRKIAENQNVWIKPEFSNDNNFNNNKLCNFTVEELETGFTKTQEWEKAGENQFKEHPMLSIYYEDLVNNYELTFRQITDFLDVKYVSPKTWLKKQNPEKLNKIITNYDELKNNFIGTKWESFFEE